MILRLGTRGSRLAVVQAQAVAAALEAVGASIELVPIKTAGDRLAQVALADFGGKAVFVKELEESLLAGRIDIAVHSLKDVPSELPEGLVLGAFGAREDARDALITRDGGALEDLPPGTVVGTSSLRRRVLVLGRRPDLDVLPIRGNVDTRLAKLAEGQYDALIVAQAGLNRLGVTPKHATALAVDEFVPAVGQGILAVEARASDGAALELLKRVDDTRTRMEALAERSFIDRLGAGCHTPVAGHASSDGARLTLTGLVASLDARTVLRGSASGAAAEAPALGQALADELLARGAGPLLRAGGPGPT